MRLVHRRGSARPAGPSSGWAAGKLAGSEDARPCVPACSVAQVGPQGQGLRLGSNSPRPLEQLRAQQLLLPGATATLQPSGSGSSSPAAAVPGARAAAAQREHSSTPVWLPVSARHTVDITTPRGISGGEQHHDDGASQWQQAAHEPPAIMAAGGAASDAARTMGAGPPLRPVAASAASKLGGAGAGTILADMARLAGKCVHSTLCFVLIVFLKLIL